MWIRNVLPVNPSVNLFFVPDIYVSIDIHVHGLHSIQ